MDDREALERIYDILHNAEDARDACFSIGEIVAKILQRPDPVTSEMR